MPKERSVVGDLINFRGLVYSPVNEQGVVYLFSKVAASHNAGGPWLRARTYPEKQSGRWCWCTMV